jgi:hypothetical protein
MEKFLKFTHSGMDFLIPVNDILSVKASTQTKVDILLVNGFAHTVTNAGEVAAIILTASAANSDAKTKQQLNALVAEIGNALSTRWTSPIYEVELPYAVDGVAHAQVDFSAGTI